MKLKSFLAAVLLVINFSIGASELGEEALLEKFNETIEADLKNNPYIDRLINQNQKPTTKTSAKESFEEQFLRKGMIECGILPAPGARSAAIAARRKIRKTAQLLTSTDDSGELR
jgi:hypothetical protein